MGGRGGAGTAHSDTGATVDTGTATAQAAPAVDARTAAVNARFERFITGEVERLEHKPGDWVGIVDLRRALDARGIPRAAQDRQLKRLSAEGKVHIVPESNRKALRQEDHDAALQLAGEPNHLIGRRLKGRG